MKAREEAEKRKMPLRVMFQDEARFGRINKIKRCWAPAKIRPEVVKQIIREYTYVYGAISPLDGKSDFLTLPYMRADLMEIFLEEISIRHSDELILMIMDGASCHSEAAFKIPENIIIEKLPPYSPQLNPTENIWDEMREKFFKNYAFDSMDAVEDRLIEACRHFEANHSLIQSIAGFNWLLSYI